MRPHTLSWILLGGLTLLLAVLSSIDTTEATVPTPDPNATNPEPQEPFEGPVADYTNRMGGTTLLALTALVFLGGVAAAVVWWRRSETTKAQRVSLGMLVALGVLAVFLALGDHYEARDETTERIDTFLLPTIITLLFLGVSGAVMLMTQMDGFAQGSILLVDVIEVFILWGWLGILGGRTYVNVSNATIAMIVLVAAVLLFHQLQQERPSA